MTKWNSGAIVVRCGSLALIFGESYWVLGLQSTSIKSCIDQFVEVTMRTRRGLCCAFVESPITHTQIAYSPCITALISVALNSTGAITGEELEVIRVRNRDHVTARSTYSKDIMKDDLTVSSKAALLVR